MLLAVALQVLGVVLVSAAAFLWLGVPAALAVAGAASFAAGFAYEREA